MAVQLKINVLGPLHHEVRRQAEQRSYQRPERTCDEDPEKRPLTGSAAPPLAPRAPGPLPEPLGRLNGARLVVEEVNQVLHCLEAAVVGVLLDGIQ